MWLKTSWLGFDFISIQEGTKTCLVVLDISVKEREKGGGGKGAGVAGWWEMEGRGLRGGGGEQ